MAKKQAAAQDAPAPPDDVLTDEELQAALDAAKAEKQKKADEEAAAQAAAERAEQERAVRREHPTKYIGIVNTAGQVSYQELPKDIGMMTRTIMLHKVVYEHVDTDADDIWIYRQA